GSPEARAHRARAAGRMLEFVEATLPGVPAPERAFAADVLTTSMSAIGKRISEESRPRAEIEAWAGVMGDMYAGYLSSLAEKHAPASETRRARAATARR
ncbi:MAG TPA: hypothetical protein VFS00_07065, partial [Polyangiaceae bacterium]|nr:hypothetical protein [Polyangiaceae bacterium]